ncbi:DUF427 domain-containing protein [Curtobacterium sp. 9128]|uniref:DUF427 domain-containing protein n=1 Tax=Curtobacterium sp. 9128 TaxID=1793722 RepID=UPI0011AA45EC|nr:DUF427 domain-containing protein [Curtobacterium sp. 9128]
MQHPTPITPGPGQESVWDYPRPPRVDASSERVVVRLGGAVIADTTSAVRVLETSHPPVYYLPVSDFAPGALTRTSGSSMCEFKGRAAYFDVHGGDGRTVSRGAWTYPTPEPGFGELVDRVAVYPSEMDSCEVAGERVQAQAGDFYGGWITSRVVGPFKGEPGTMGW